MGRNHSALFVALFSLMSFTACITLSHCSDEKPLEPEPTRPIDTTSHEFVWYLDTIPFSANFDGTEFYGSSASNVYLAGISDAPDNMCYHWDGIEWKKFIPAQYWMSSEIVGIDGLDSSYVVFTSTNETDRGKLAIIDRGQLRYINSPKNIRYTSCIRVVSKNEIYLGGVDGVFKFSDGGWTTLLDSSKSVVDSYGARFLPIYIEVFDDNTLEFISQRNMNPEPTKFYRWRYSNNVLSAIDSFSYKTHDNGSVNFGYARSNYNGKFYTTGFGGTFYRQGRDWVKMMDLGGAYISGGGNNLFISMTSDAIWHYNGKSLYNLYPEMESIFGKIQLLYGVYYVDDILFVSMRRNNRNIVARGIQRQ